MNHDHASLISLALEVSMIIAIIVLNIAVIICAHKALREVNKALREIDRLSPALDGKKCQPEGSPVEPFVGHDGGAE